MSSTLTVYAISFERLERVPGSRDLALVGAIGTELEDFLARIDELRDDEDETPSCREAVAQIVAGAPLSPHLGYLYGFALEAICAYIGRELPNVSGICGTSAWVDQVDDYLRSEGVPVGLAGLIYGGCPVEIPEPDDYPFIGSWPPQVIPSALGAIRGVETEGLDYEMAETIAQIRAWLEAAAENPEEGLIGFLS
jgi:hypothetical protein